MVTLHLELNVRMFSAHILNLAILSGAVKLISCSDLDKRSFALRSRINVLENRQDRTYLPVVVVHETYSAKQFRARLDYEILEVPGQEEQLGQVYHDQLNGITLLHDQTRIECKLANLKELDQMFGLIDLNLLQDGGPQRSHLLGPARLLQFIEDNNDKLVLENGNVSDNYRNIELSKYRLSHGQLDLTIFYTSTKQRKLLDNPIPVQVSVKSPNGWMTVDFNQLRLLQEDREELCRLDDDYGIIEPDRFALPKNAACISALKDKMKPLFGDPKMIRVSFDSKMTQFLNDESILLKGPDLSVAYDAQLRSLRLDTINIHPPLTTSLLAARKVVNFKTSRVYQVYEKSKSQQPMADCRVLKMYGRGEKITMGYLLAGSDFFVHLGRAQVRGQRALLYATLSSAQPIWLEQQLEYTTGDGKARLRDPRRGLTELDERGITYLYVSEHDMPELLAMDIINQFGNKILFQFFNFAWQFDSLKWSSDMFSLSELCSSQESEHYARAELLLESTNWQPWSQSITRLEQDSTLLVAFQDFLSLPVNMVYDLETRSLFKNRFLFAQFNVATHTSTQTELVYLGRGNPSPGLAGGTLNHARSFQSCLQAAITAKSSTFGYSIQTQLCYENHRANLDKQQSKSFKLEPSGQMEFYSLREAKKSHLERNYNSKGRWIESSTKSFTKRQLLGSRLFLRIGDTGLAWFTVKQLQISELNRSSQEEDAAGADGESDKEVDKYEGIGLTKELAIDRASTQRKNPEKKLGEVGSLPECRWACLSDLNCQSYSVCRRRHELQCVTSRLNFKSDSASRQLRIALRQITTSKLVLVQLESSSEPLKLVRHSSCTLYNKVHLDLFAKRGLYMRSAGRSQLVGVSGREDCAAQCAAMSAKVLARDSSLSEEWSLHNRPQQVDSLQQTAGSAGRLLELFEARRQNGLQFCHGFHYIDSSQLDDAKLELHTEDRVEGYCLFNAAVGPSSAADTTFEAMTFELYQLNLINFYEKQNGLRLRASNVEPDEQAIYQKAKVGSALDEQELRRLAKLLLDGHNFQEVIYADKAKCADICFGGAIGQAMRPWPGCRSFDLELDERKPSSTGAARCHLNSMSLEEALLHNRLDLVDDETVAVAAENSSEHLISFSHFELRHGMLAVAGADERAAGKLVKLEQPSHMGALSIIVGSVALICGFLLAHQYNRQLQRSGRDADETTALEVGRARQVKDAPDVNRENPRKASPISGCQEAHKEALAGQMSF